MNKIVVAYFRSSSEENQNRQLNSIPAQKTKMQEWAKWNNARVVKSFEDKHTGKEFNRPNFKKMWAFCRDNKGLVTHLLCTEVTRFGREGADYLKWFKKFRSVGVQVNFIEEWINFEVPEMLSLFYYRIGTAEAESERISKRTKDTKADIRQKGYYADVPPRAWKYAEERDKNGRKKLIPNEPLFSMYQKALKLFANSSLKQSEVIQQIGDSIKTSTFSRLLRNPLVAGYIPIYDYSFGKITERPILDIVNAKDNVAPLISWKEYQIIQEKIKKVKSPKIGTLAVAFNEEFPLKKIIKCKDCGKNMTASKSKGRHGKYFPYYHCKSKHQRINANKAHTALADALEVFTVKESEKSVMNRAALAAMEYLGMTQGKKQEQAKKALNEVNQKIEKLKGDYLKIDSDMFADLMAGFRSEKQELETQIQSIDRQKSIGTETQLNLINLLSTLNVWFSEQSTPHQKHEFFRMFFPEGFTMEDLKVRTPRINSVVSLMWSLSEDYENKKGITIEKSTVIPAADATGTNLEPLFNDDLWLVRQFFYLKEAG